jgi:hypothetical protein
MKELSTTQRNSLPFWLTNHSIQDSIGELWRRAGECGCLTDENGGVESFVREEIIHAAGHDRAGALLSLPPRGRKAPVQDRGDVHEPVLQGGGGADRDEGVLALGDGHALPVLELKTMLAVHFH